MTDPRFYDAQGPISLATLVDLTGGEAAGPAGGEATFDDVAPLDDAGPRDVTFLDNPQYKDRLKATRAGLCLARPAVRELAPEGLTLLLCDDPYRAYARVAGAFHPPARPAPGIAASAVVAGDAVVPESSRIDAGAMVESGVEMGHDCVIGANACIGAGVVLGDRVRVGAGAVLAYCLVGNDVILHPGVALGQDGFGFGMGGEGHLKVPQLGRVHIENDVEIGANTTIDRGSARDTVVGAGSKIDNLVQIGHNVVLGHNCVICAQVGIAGSARLEDHVVVGGQSGFNGHITVGAGARVAARSGVTNDVPAGTTVGGFPAVPIREFRRQSAVLARMGRQGDTQR